MESTLSKVILVSSVCSVCFGLRCICALIVSITYIYKIGPSYFVTFDQAIYPTLYYTAPEIIPSLTLVYVLLGFQGMGPPSTGLTKVVGSTENEDDDDDEEDDEEDEEEEIRTLDGPTRKHQKRESKMQVQADPFMTRFNDTKNSGVDWIVEKSENQPEISYSSL